MGEGSSFWLMHRKDTNMAAKPKAVINTPYCTSTLDWHALIPVFVALPAFHMTLLL